MTADILRNFGMPSLMNSATTTFSQKSQDNAFYVFTTFLSLAALLFLGWLLVWRQGGGAAQIDLRFLPQVNASLNSLAAACLVTAFLAIRTGHRRAHQYLMVSAFVASALFLACYVAYHFVHGDTKYTGQGWLRGVYFFILISHIVLSTSVLPLALTSFYLAFRQRLEQHKKVTRWTFPIWLYVSVTGVLIYFFLRGSPPAIP